MFTPGSRSTPLRRAAGVAGLVAAAVTLSACGSSTSAGSSTSTSTSTPTSSSAASSGSASDAGGAASGSGSASGGSGTLRLGYFANVTHAAAVLGVSDGTFAKDLGGTALKTQIFNAGPAAIEALNAGSIDAAFLGPSPAINAYDKSKGQSLRIVAGATANGAELVVKAGITSAADLKGKKIATPQLGGTQDVSLRKYLFDNGLKTQTNGGSDVDVVNQDNSQTLQLFQSGQVDGGWLPEPWASRLVAAGGKVLVDEKTLWPNQQFPTTILIVAQPYLQAHPDVVKNLIDGELDEIAAITKDPTAAAANVNAAIGKLTNGKPLADAVATSAFANIKVTSDPLASTYDTSGQHALDAGLTKKKPAIDGILDLRILNGELKARGQQTVSAGSLGQE